jgi:hypothetical protein
MDVFQSAFSRAVLTRRVPGASLAESAPKERQINVAPQRNPEAERSAFDSFVHAWDKADKENPL